jgi:hypothetical protein
LGRGNQRRPCQIGLSPTSLSHLPVPKLERIQCLMSSTLSCSPNAASRTLALPYELLNAVFTHLSDAQLAAVQRVNATWQRGANWELEQRMLQRPIVARRNLDKGDYSVWEGGRTQSILFCEDQPFVFQRSYATDTSQGYFVDCVMDIQTGRRKFLTTNRDSQVSDYEGHHFEKNERGLAIRRGRRVNNLETYQTNQ